MAKSKVKKPIKSNSNSSKKLSVQDIDFKKGRIYE